MRRVVVALAIATALLGLVIHGRAGPVGVHTTTPSGLVIDDLTVGKGAVPGPNRPITVAYVASLSDGTVIDSSEKRGAPMRFFLDDEKIIKGFAEGTATMAVGGRRRLVIPPHLAYGANEHPQLRPHERPHIIGKNATVTFEVELLDVGEVVPRPAGPPDT